MLIRGCGYGGGVASLTCEWRTTLAGITVDSIYTDAVVQTGPGCTFIHVLLTVHT